MATKTAHASRPAFATVESFLAQVGGPVKTAEANTEPGGYDGPTTHPVKNVPDGTRTPAPEGARSKENEKDVREDQGPPSVDSTDASDPHKAAEAEGGAESGVGSAEHDQVQVGTKKSPTGEDPSVETGSAKPGKEDGDHFGASTHPARTDNSELNGGKYAADKLAAAPLEKLAEMIQELGDEICADLVNDGTSSKQASAATPATPATQPQFEQLAEKVGWEMAAMLTGKLDKQAADAIVVQTIDGLIKAGEDDADRVNQFLTDYETAKAKQAHDGEHHEEHYDGGGAPPMDPTGGAGAPPMDPTGVAGGDPTGGDPTGSGDPEVEQIKQMLDQLGVTPQQLMQAIMQEEGGAGGAGGPGGPPPGGDPAGGTGGGLPPGGPGGPGGAPDPATAAMMAQGPGGGAAGPPTPPQGMQVTAADRGGRTRPSKAAVASYVKEVVARSKTRR